ncbi:MAG: U32 family peptidase [Alphaproteobacteria bacterium]|nr:U32 family peptidase [Alphaproteobacteria bacterium]
MAPKASRLTLGPVLFHWPGEMLRDFHLRMADEAAVDRVVLGEVVCPKRAPELTPHLAEIVHRYRAAGKEVVFATPALAMSTAERRLTAAALEAADQMMVEANDLAALATLDGRDHAIGPYVNAHNEDTIAWLAQRGARRICLTPELPLRSIASIANALTARDLDVGLEVLVFGRVPLSLSARCYHARIHDRSRDDCAYVCAEDPDGLAVDTLDGEPFLAVNGPQAMSQAWLNLMDELPVLTSLGIEGFRLSPQSCDMVVVAAAFRDVLDGRTSLEEGASRLRQSTADAGLFNGFLHDREGVALVPRR